MKRGLRNRTPATAALASAFAALWCVSASAAQQAGGVQLKGGVSDAPAKPKPAKKPAAQTASRSAADGGGIGASAQSIAALVNDEPVTGFEIQQRAAMLGGGSVNAQAQANFQALIKSPRTTERLKEILNETIKANPGKSKDEILAIFDKRKKDFGASLQRQAVDSARSASFPAMKRQALEELIDERLKLQEAKRLNVIASEDEVSRTIAGIAERNKISEAELAVKLGGSLDVMKQRIRATLSWNEVVRRQFGSQLTVTSRDIDKLVATGAAAAEDQSELTLQRIRLALPAKISQGDVAKRVQDAEVIRAKFTDCKSSGQIAAGVPGAKFDEIGKRRPSGIPEPTRTLLLNAGDGEMLPASVGDGAVELWIVCARTVLKAEEQQRTAAEGELKQKEFELLSRRRLKDLRNDAHIEYR